MSPDITQYRVFSESGDKTSTSLRALLSRDCNFKRFAFGGTLIVRGG
jgi:hypothetical protein